MLKVFENNSLCKRQFFSDLFLKFLLYEICPSLGIHVSRSLNWKGRLTECENRSPHPDFDMTVLNATSSIPAILVFYFKNERIGLNLLRLKF